MLTICFYQDARHEEPLRWIRRVLGIGYLSRRNDGMTELRINGFAQVERVVSVLLPYIKFKKKQAVALLDSARLLNTGDKGERAMRKLVRNILIVQSENYATRRKRSEKELLSIFSLTP